MSPDLAKPLSTSSRLMLSFEVSIMCSLIIYCKSDESQSIGLPPTAAIAAVDPVDVDIHIPEDQTFKLLSMSYDLPANLVFAPSFGMDGKPVNLWQSIFDNQPRRNRDTDAGDGSAISRSFNPGTNCVSEKVDFTLQRIRVLLTFLLFAVNYRCYTFDIHFS